jgi:hypothetical protein
VSCLPALSMVPLSRSGGGTLLRAGAQVLGRQMLTTVPVSELFIELIVPELGLRVRLSLSNDLEVELALNLAVQNLQLPISDLSQVLGKIILRGEMQFLRHHVLHNAMPVQLRAPAMSKFYGHRDGNGISGARPQLWCHKEGKPKGSCVAGHRVVGQGSATGRRCLGCVTGEQ